MFEHELNSSITEHNNIKAIRVAVTGSTGMIGCHLVAELVRAGYRDIVLPVRNKSKVERIYGVMLSLGVEWVPESFAVVEADIQNEVAMTEVFRGVDTVFHCAAAIMVGEMTEQQLIENNVSLARCVADASVNAGVRRIIHTSSIIVFAPDEARGQKINEKNREHGDEESGAYGISKYRCDLEMKRVAAKGVELITLYPAVVLGEGDWSLNGSSAIVPLIARGLPFYTNGVMSYIDVRDVARAYVTVAEDERASGQGFILSGADLTYRELLSLGAKAAGKRSPFIKIGKRAIFSVYYLIRVVIFLRLMKDNKAGKRKFESILYGNRYSGEKIEHICGFKYTPVEETIIRVVGAYLRNSLNKGNF